MILLTEHEKVAADIKKLPAKPGVYLFKDAEGHILYIGKAKNLKKRGANYLQRAGRDVKVDSLLQESDHLDHQITGTELEAMLLEAQLIQSNQPKFNVLLKTGQPFIFLLFTANKLPELKLVRNRKQKGTYLGPFLEKAAARQVYDFLIKTFRLKLCKKKIENGCLDYHLGICAGKCRPDFDEAAYTERLNLARRVMSQGHKVFLDDLMAQIQACNKREEFERARELHGYYTACHKVFSYLDIKPMSVGGRVGHDIWILADDKRSLHVLIEQQNVLRLKQSFYFPFVDIDLMQAVSSLRPGVATADRPSCTSLGEPPYEPQNLEEYFIGYYRTFRPAIRILVNFDLAPAERDLYQQFLTQWHHLDQPVTIMQPTIGHELSLIRYATVQVAQELIKKATLGQSLKRLLKLAKEPRKIDCFDISHKQGMFMVGSCVRFTDGQPDKKMFRHFHIKTVKGQDDYASLAEIVGRRYRDGEDLPDLVVIDGGKGQLSATRPLIPDGVDVISLAKREETVYADRLPEGRRLDKMTFAGQLLIALRDYTHHFAISFHRKIARKGLDNGV